MSGFHQDINVDDKATPCVEPAPEIGIVVRFGDRKQPAILTVDEPTTLHFGTFEVEVTVVDVIRKKIRPASKPPYHWIIKNDEGTTEKIRAMSEENARRLFYQRHGIDSEIVEIEAEIV